MNHRTRYCHSLLFNTVDRIPLEPGKGRESTMKRWQTEGLPTHIRREEIAGYAYRQAGGTLEMPASGPQFPVNERMIPEFEEKIISRTERSQIVQDWKGNICEISSDFELRHLRNAIDFVTRRWIKCPVENRQDWQAMKRRYDINDPSRIPDLSDVDLDSLKNRQYPLTLQFSGPFWQLREWLGFENLCMMLHDDPALVEEMIEFWKEFVSALLRKAFQFVVPDIVYISEDMAYKGFSMISPAMCRQFLLPCWTQWGQVIHSAGVPIYAIDSDGFIGELIPLWIEAGINCCDPIEVAAGNDICAFRKEFGKQMAYRGGVDKRAMAAGGKTIEDEINRITPVIESGGYIPGCDHGVPHDVSWPNFVHYVRLLAQRTGWL